MTKYITILLTFLATNLFGQTEKIQVKKLEPIPAEYPGGNKAMLSYYNSAIIPQIQGTLNTLDRIHFKAWVLIDENGKVIQVDLIKGSSYRDIDSIFIQSTRQMPLWIPATNDVGIKCKDKKTVNYKIH